MKYSDDIIEQIWQKGQIVEGYKSDVVRKDACGAWIIRSLYGDTTSPFGWEIDHIYPKSRLQELGFDEAKIEDIRNLRPLNSRNNLSKSDAYPSYVAVITSEDNKNIECSKQFIINATIQEELKELYNL